MNARSAAIPRVLRRLLVGLLGFLVVFALVYVAVRPFRVAVLTLAFVPELFEDAPRPLSAVTPTPTRASVAYGLHGDRMDLYLPAASPADFGPRDRRPAVLVVLGIEPAPLDDPRVERFGLALARLGIVAAFPESRDMTSGRLTADEPSRLVEAFETVAANAAVDPAQVSIVGFSIGGGIALLAAADQRIADRVQLVNVFGSYSDAGLLLGELASRHTIRDGSEVGWEPRAFARQALLELVLDLVPDTADRARVRERVEPLILAETPPVPGDWDAAFAATLGPQAAAAYRLLTAPDLATARAAVAAFVPLTRDGLARLSPAGRLDGIRTRVYLMHDTGDAVIPYGHLAGLAAAVPADQLARVSTFSLFDHISPRGVDLGAVPELAALYLHIVDVVGLAL